MKKIIIASVLAASTASAMAEWTKVEEGLEGETVYIDLQTVRKDVNRRKVWLIYDMKQLDQYGAMSYRMRYEYDCKAKRWRYIALFMYSQRMARGKILKSDPPASLWVDIPPAVISRSS